MFNNFLLRNLENNNDNDTNGKTIYNIHIFGCHFEGGIVNLFVDSDIELANDFNFILDYIFALRIIKIDDEDRFET